MDWCENRETTMNLINEHDQVTLCDIIGATSDRPWNAWEFPQIRPSKDHIILYQVSQKGSREKPPMPYKDGEDKWNDNYVRMPHSNSNQYDKELIYSWNKKTGSRWTLIKKSLEQKISDSKALIGAILKYNGKYKDVWKFGALELYLNVHLRKTEKEDFFKYTLPGIIKLALQLPDLIQAPIPLLKQHQCKSLSLSQAQIASLLANAFLCTFPWRNSTASHSAAAKLPKINFASLFEGAEESVFQKLRCICNYFRRVTSETPIGVVTFSRRFVPSLECPEWKTRSDPIESVPVYVDSKRKIDDAGGLIQVVFANKFLGGGLLGSGLVQEEIRFLMCPELMASMVFTELLGSKEALMIIGCERYNNYRGYGHDSFRWVGDHRDTTPVDSSRRRRCAVLAIDAEPYRNQYEQFQKPKVERELNKAWVGFSFFGVSNNHLQYPGVATGNWGCGAFNGAPQLKCLIQMMAAAVAGRPLAYHTFGDEHFKHEVETVYDLCRCQDVTVGELFKCIVEYNFETDLHSFLKQKLVKKSSQYRNANKFNEFTRYENEEQHSQGNNVQFENSDLPHAEPSSKSDYHSQKTPKETRNQIREQENNFQFQNSDLQHAGSSSKSDYHSQKTPKETRNQIREQGNNFQFQNSDLQHAGSSSKSDYHSQKTPKETRNQIREQGNNFQFQNSDLQHAGSSSKSDYHSQKTPKETRNQRSEHQNISTTSNHLHPQNKASCSQNLNRDGHRSQNNFQRSPKNYDQHSDNSGSRGGHSPMDCSTNRSRRGPSQAQGRMSNDAQWSSKLIHQSGSQKGSSWCGPLLGGTRFSEVLKGAPQRKRQDDSSNIYEITNNVSCTIGHSPKDCSTNRSHRGPSQAQGRMTNDAQWSSDIYSQNNFLCSPKNYGQHSDNSGIRGGHSQKDCSPNRSGNGPSQTQDQMSNDAQWSSDIHQSGSHQGSSGCGPLLGSRRFSEILKGAPLRKRQDDASNIYEITNNVTAARYTMRKTAEGIEAPDNA